MCTSRRKRARTAQEKVCQVTHPLLPTYTYIWIIYLRVYVCEHKTKKKSSCSLCTLESMYINLFSRWTLRAFSMHTHTDILKSNIYRQKPGFIYVHIQYIIGIYIYVLYVYVHESTSPSKETNQQVAVTLSRICKFVSAAFARCAAPCF